MGLTFSDVCCIRFPGSLSINACTHRGIGHWAASLGFWDILCCCIMIRMHFWVLYSIHEYHTFLKYHEISISIYFWVICSLYRRTAGLPPFPSFYLHVDVKIVKTVWHQLFLSRPPFCWLRRSWGNRLHFKCKGCFLLLRPFPQHRDRSEVSPQNLDRLGGVNRAPRMINLRSAPGVIESECVRVEFSNCDCRCGKGGFQ